MFLEPQFDTVVDNTARNAFWLGRGTMIKSNFRGLAVLHRIGLLVTDQSESGRITSIFLVYLSHLDRLQM